MVTKKQKTGFIEAIAPHPKTQTELKRRIRSMSHSDAFLAVAWLNATQGKPANRRVLAIRQELADLADARETLRQQRRALQGKRGQSAPEIMGLHAKRVTLAELQEQFRKRHNVLNVRLTRYAHVPALAYSPELAIWRFGMVPKRPSGPEIVIEDQSLRVRVNESSVIAALCRLAANRELHKVRLCEMCGKRWRVSERKIDRFCTPKCREEFYAKSDEYRERKAANQRKYREGLKRARANGVTLR
jgi:hypothetical protein